MSIYPQIMFGNSFPWLSAIILFPLVAALAIPLIGDRQIKLVRWYALGVGLVDLAMTLYAFGSHYNFEQSTIQPIPGYPSSVSTGL